MLLPRLFCETKAREAVMSILQHRGLYDFCQTWVVGRKGGGGASKSSQLIDASDVFDILGISLLLIPTYGINSVGVSEDSSSLYLVPQTSYLVMLILNRITSPTTPNR